MAVSAAEHETLKKIHGNFDGDSILSRLPDSNLSVAIALEASRLSAKYNKDVFGAEDLVQILGVGMNNIRELMRSRTFPTISIGSRKVVSVLGFAAWTVRLYMK
jgi:hypothetical protein